MRWHRQNETWGRGHMKGREDQVETQDEWDGVETPSSAGPPRLDPFIEGPTIEVVPQHERWRIRGAGEADDVFKDRSRAVAVARAIAREAEALLTIFDEEGMVEEQQDYGAMGIRPSPEADVTGEAGIEATSRAEERSMHRG
jgi:hypothetical protein